MRVASIFKFLVFSFFLFSLCPALAQTPVEFQIIHKLGTSDFTFGTAQHNNLGDEFTVSRIEYYISKLSIRHDGGIVTEVPNHYILANGRVPVIDSLGSFSITNVESISFYIGVDTPLNNADPSLQPTRSALAPHSPSMHWGWISGYRFIAMEGICGNTIGLNYEVHAIGNAFYKQTTVNATGVMEGGKLVIAINADYIEALRDIHLSSGLLAHGWGPDEAMMINNFNQHVFSAGKPLTIVGSGLVNEGVNIYPNPSTSGNSKLVFNNPLQSAVVSISDVQGRQSYHIEKRSGDQEIEICIPQSGIYFLRIELSDGSVRYSKLVIQ